MIPYLHPEDITLFTEVCAAMRRVAAEYKLPLKDIKPTPNATLEKSALGYCSTDGVIYLTLRCKDKNGEWTAPRSADSVWDTAAHELAHLRHFNHGPAFQEFEEELKMAMRNRKQNHRDKIIDKLIKLQRQRDSEAKLGNLKAAEAFAAAVNRLLIEYELNPTDIDYARASDDDPIIELSVDLSKYHIEAVKNRVAWQEKLASVVARANLCRILIIPGTNNIIFVGTRSHASVAEYIYGMLVPAAHQLSIAARYEYGKQLKREGRDPKLNRGYRGAWLSAFVDRIRERLEEQRAAIVEEDKKRREEMGEVDPSSTALVRLNGALRKVDDYIDGKFKSRRRYAGALNGGWSGHAEGRAHGKAAADAMPIGRRGVTGGGPRGLLG